MVGLYVKISKYHNLLRMISGAGCNLKFEISPSIFDFVSMRLSMLALKMILPLTKDICYVI